MYKLFLTLRYLRSKLIALFAVLAVTLCVGMVLIVFSVMDGFLDNIRQHSRGLLSDIIIDNATLQGFPYYDEFVARMYDDLPEVVKYATPVIYNYGILRIPSNNFTKPVRVVGIDLDGYRLVNNFGESLYYEEHFPGTTRFERAPQPLAGLDFDALPEGVDTLTFDQLMAAAVLPSEFEEAHERYLVSHPDFEPEMERARFRPHGIGQFQYIDDEPSYVGSPMPGLVIGTDVVYTRYADGTYDRMLLRGQEVVLTLLPVTVKGTIAEDPVPVAMRHIDDSRTKVYDIDSICVYADFKLMQDLLSMDALERVDGTMLPPRTSQLLVQLQPDVDLNEAQERIALLWDAFLEDLYASGTAVTDGQLLSFVSVETWEQRQIQFIAAVEKEKVLVTVLFGIISSVAVVLISVLFYMIVLQKTRDIGLLKSIGASRRGTAAIFLGYGAVIGLIGGLLGVIGGTIVVQNINEIQDLLAQFNPNLRVWSPDVYTFDRIPSLVKTEVIVGVWGMAIVTAILGSLVPAIKAASVWPVEALRYE